MRLLAILLLCFSTPILAQDGTRFRLEIGVGPDGKPSPVNAELGKQFEAVMPAGPGAQPRRVSGEIVRSTRAARGREVLDIVLSVHDYQDAAWRTVASATLKVPVGSKGEVAVEDADGANPLAISALVSRL
jgi:hypothetical protein